ncbi:glycosyltransferase [Photobacterium carnosum]|uniref:glycosyltransferase family 2 protein n=1 Tax=Photobacterium carnosum TaxID=2023717 RepID=UPI001E590F16|nr:glycosyltransferase [Photobacterium carnosum]
MKIPKVSFLIPAYNCENTIQESICSALNQTEKNIEVVIVDDGSTDNTKEKIKEIKDSRIVYIYKDNGGVSSALNLGLKYCKSEIIARLDSDDIAHVNRIEVQLKEFVKNPDLVLLGTGVDFIDSDSVVVGKFFPVYFKSLEKEIFLKINIYPHPSVMFRKNAVIKAGLYEEKLSGFFEDYYLWGKLKKIGNCKIIPYSLTSYRISENQITNWKASEEYNDLVAKIINKGEISDFNLNRLKKLKERDKTKKANIVSNRKKSSTKNIYYKLYLGISEILNENLSYRIVCLIKNIRLIVKLMCK